MLVKDFLFYFDDEITLDVYSKNDVWMGWGTPKEIADMYGNECMWGYSPHENYIIIDTEDDIRKEKGEI